MLASPLTVTINSVAKSLASIGPIKVGTGGTGTAYVTDDGVYTLTAEWAERRARRRHVVRLDHKGLDADPLTDGSYVPVSCSMYLVIDRPFVGYVNTDLKDMALGLTGFLNSATLLKLLGKET